MKRQRQRTGFQPLGGVSPDGLPVGPRARQLHLAWAWSRVAGAAVARGAVVRGLRRGVLEIEVAQGAWVRALKELLPRLAGRLAADHPELGVRKFRLVGDGQPDRSRPLEVPPLPENDEVLPPRRPSAAPPGNAASPRSGSGAGPAEPGPVGQRLETLARAYLARLPNP